MNYQTPVPADAGYPTGIAQVSWFQVLSGIATMPIETRLGGGGFWASTSTPYDPAAVFRFHDPALVNYPDNCSTTYVITRISPSQWSVTTGELEGTSHETSQFENGSGSPFYGNYKMPFSMLITCLDTCSPIR